MNSDTARIEAFSDGVFAIAITLLVLELKVPALAQGKLSSALLAQWPSYFAFLLSFAFIGVMWINHHRMFAHIRKSNNVLLVLNLLLLLGVTTVPFPTAVLASYLGTGEGKVAAILYNSTYVFIAISFNLLWRYSVSRHLFDDDFKPAEVGRISRQYAFGPLLYLLCLGIAFISVPLSLATNTALAIFFLLPPHIATGAKRRGKRSGISF